MLTLFRDDSLTVDALRSKRSVRVILAVGVDVGIRVRIYGLRLIFIVGDIRAGLSQVFAPRVDPFLRLAYLRSIFSQVSSLLGGMQLNGSSCLLLRCLTAILFGFRSLFAEIDDLDKIFLQVFFRLIHVYVFDKDFDLFRFCEFGNLSF